MSQLKYANFLSTGNLRLCDIIDNTGKKYAALEKSGKRELSLGIIHV